MTSSELLGCLKRMDGLLSANRKSYDYGTPTKKGQIVCPYHGSREVGKGLASKIKKDAGLK